MTGSHVLSEAGGIANNTTVEEMASELIFLRVGALKCLSDLEFTLYHFHKTSSQIFEVLECLVFLVTPDLTGWSEADQAFRMFLGFYS